MIMSFSRSWGTNMKILTILLSAFIIASCASTQSILASSPTEAFRVYQTKVTKANVSANASQYFAETLLKGKNLADPSIQSQLLFKVYMNSEKQEIYQTVKDNSACLTINGYDKEKLPVSFNLAYLKINNSWLISKIAVVFHESDSEFENNGKCPA